jgi:hypothetical protein
VGGTFPRDDVARPEFHSGKSIKHDATLSRRSAEREGGWKVALVSASLPLGDKIIASLLDGGVTMTRFLVVLFASLVAASCAAVRTSVAVTHAMPAMGSARTIAILPYTNNLAAAPGYQGNAAKLAAQLQAKGYTVVPPQGAQAPDYLAFFMYEIDGGTPVNQLEGRPAPNTGSIITYGLRTTYSTSTRRIYSRMVTLEIVDRARFQPSQPATYLDARVYSGSVVSDGACSEIAPVIDPMLMALFADFPGASGRLQRVDIPADFTCGLSRYG